MIQEPNQRSASQYVIENVDVWTPKGVRKNQKVYVEDGVLKGIGDSAEANSAAEKFDGKGKVLMPAGVDAQTHLRVPGQAHKELPQTGLLAALKGGYCAVLTMPNTQPTIDCVDVLNQGREAVKP